MKSTVKSPFDVAVKSQSLFSKAELSTMKNFAVAKTLDRKVINFYSKAKLNAK